jgi:DnaJ-domain-containing protein 1
MAWPLRLNLTSQNKASGKPGVKFPREHERVAAQGITCHLGQVLDISAGGMRIRTEGTPGVQKGDTLSFGVRSSRHKVSVQGQVLWTRRSGWKNYEIGVRWLDASPIHVELLLQLARYGFVNIEEARGDAIPGMNGAASTSNGSRASSNGSGAAHGAAPAVEDLYKVLSVARTSTPEQIHSAFRALARKLHPDVNKEAGAQERFTEVNKAYSVLRDAETRRRYDILLAGGSRKTGR